MKKGSQKSDNQQYVLKLDKIDAGLRSDVDALIKARTTYVENLSMEPSDDQMNYLAALTDLASQLRTAVILLSRVQYFQSQLNHN